jgi:hypothetical protein
VLGGSETGQANEASVLRDLASTLAKAGISAVVTKQISILDRCAIAVSRGFYKAAARPG